MEPMAIDGTTLRLLMAAGAVFAAVGLWLLLKPRGEGAAKFELFGMKVESSSAGVIVFLIGAAFLAVPILVPEKAGGPLATRDPDEPAVSVTAQQQEEVPEAPAQGRSALVLPAMANARESEPNDSVHSANQISPGSTVRGRVLGADEDWYVIGAGEQSGRAVEIGLRHIDGLHIGAEIFDAQERSLGSVSQVRLKSGVVRRTVEVGGNERLYVKVDAVASEPVYELFYTFKDVEF